MDGTFSKSADPSALDRASWLRERPFTLVMSAGFFGFFAHTGLLAALEEAELRPTRVVGISAGALAGGLWASGLSAQDIARELMALRRDDFWDPGLPLGGLLRGRKFQARLEGLLAQTGTFDVEHCPVAFTPIVHDVFARRPVCVERGPLVRAIVASCCVPGMFRPVWSDGKLWVDGGVSDRWGTCALSASERVLLHGLRSRRRGVGEPPVRGDTLTLVIDDLPKVGPFALQHGPSAFEHARGYVRRWLREPARG